MYGTPAEGSCQDQVFDNERMQTVCRLEFDTTDGRNVPRRSRRIASYRTNSEGNVSDLVTQPDFGHNVILKTVPDLSTGKQMGTP